MPLPSSGSLTMSDINASFGRGNNLNAYRGQTWYTGNLGEQGTFPSAPNSISFSDFRGRGAIKPWVNTGNYYSNLSPQTTYTAGDCISGWGNGWIRISSTQGITIHVDWWRSDYGIFYLSNMGYNGNYYVCQSNAFIDSTGTPFNATIYGNAYFHYGRDTPAFRVRTYWDGVNLTVYVDFDCKGGSSSNRPESGSPPWAQCVFAAVIPYNVVSSSPYSWTYNFDASPQPHTTTYDDDGYYAAEVF
jgi:hypothetical protein